MQFFTSDTTPPQFASIVLQYAFCAARVMHHVQDSPTRTAALLALLKCRNATIQDAQSELVAIEQRVAAAADADIRAAETSVGLSPIATSIE